MNRISEARLVRGIYICIYILIHICVGYNFYHYSLVISFKSNNSKSTHLLMSKTKIQTVKWQQLAKLKCSSVNVCTMYTEHRYICIFIVLIYLHIFEHWLIKTTAPFQSSKTKIYLILTHKRSCHQIDVTFIIISLYFWGFCIWWTYVLCSSNTYYLSFIFWSYA